MLIQVTQDNIDKGVPSCTGCPIALAIKRATGASAVRVDTFPTQVRVNGKSVLLPESAEKFIRWFDQLGRGEPFEFELSFD